MRLAISVLIIYAAFLLIWPVNAYCDDSAPSSVVVIGPTEKSSSQTSGAKPANAGVGRMGASGLDLSALPTKEGDDVSKDDADKVIISGSPDNSSSRIVYEISGSKVGDTKVSQEVSIPSEGVVMSVDAGMSKAFIIVKVEEDGKEILALNAEPERAIGARLPKGIYKVYPQDPDGAFAFDKLTAKVRIGLVESKIGESQ